MIVLLFLTVKSVAQIPASFERPILGYIFDPLGHAIHPVVGIPGSSKIGPPLDLGLSVSRAVILGDRRHALVDSADARELVVVDLEEASRRVLVLGTRPNVTSINPSSSGETAGLHYVDSNQMLLVGGLFEAPGVRATIDLSVLNRDMSHYAVSDDGDLALVAVLGDQEELLYSWTRTNGLRFLTAAARVADIAFINGDAVVADAGGGRILMIREIRGQASVVLVADFREGISSPTGISVSSRQDIVVSDAGSGTVSTFDANGGLLRQIRCGCVPTGMSPFGDSSYRLTDRLDRPVYVLENGSGTDRIFFIPAMESSTGGLP